MQLWTDYEGRTIADAYPLEKLLTPEGRSAFFSTHNGTGNPAVIRLIEAHFDEAEILARWSQIAEINQPNLVALRKCGQTTLDGTALVYAVMEPADANLAEVLKDRPLSIEEARQVATSLTAAIEALHARNLIHEHIEPPNVLAIGEVIKLRSDCIREAPEGQEGVNLKARDVHDLGILLLQSLTLQRTPSSAGAQPAPFSEIIRNAISGAWGLPQIAAALAPSIQSPPKLSTRPPVASMPDIATKAAPTPPAAPVIPAPVTPAPVVRDRIIRPVEPAPARRTGLWIACALGALLLLLLVWRLFRPSSATTSTKPISTLATVGTEGASPTPAPPPTAASRPVSRAATISPGDSRAQWRVVAFTYNRQDQARQKVDSLARQHSSLHPEVFTPTGHAPFLVTVGGLMNHDEATAFRNKARSAGLPRDTYVQNYTR